MARAAVRTKAAPPADKPSVLLPPITEEVAAVLSAQDGSVGSAKLEELKEVANDALSDLSIELEVTRSRSLDPSLSAAAARCLRDEADDQQHEMHRLEAAIARIDEALPKLKAAEHQAAIRPAYQAHKAKRAALVERIRIEWPALTAKMIDLLDAIEAFRQAPGVEIPEGEDPLRIDVEAEARGCDSSFYQAPYEGAGVAPLKRLRDSQIVRFQPSAREDERMAWPRYRRQIG